MDAARPTPATAAQRADRRPVGLRDLLAVSTRRTRLELVCWELNIDERQARPTWELALQNALLEPQGVDALTGQPMFTLSERGRNVLRDLSRQRGRGR